MRSAAEVSAAEVRLMAETPVEARWLMSSNHWFTDAGVDSKLAAAGTGALPQKVSTTRVSFTAGTPVEVEWLLPAHWWVTDANVTSKLVIARCALAGRAPDEVDIAWDSENVGHPVDCAICKSQKLSRR